MITKTCVNTISRCLKQIDLISFISLQIAITKTAVNTTRRCDLTSVLYGLIFHTVYESKILSLHYKLLIIFSNSLSVDRFLEIAVFYWRDTIALKVPNVVQTLVAT